MSLSYGKACRMSQGVKRTQYQKSFSHIYEVLSLNIHHNGYLGVTPLNLEIRSITSLKAILYSSWFNNLTACSRNSFTVAKL